MIQAVSPRFTGRIWPTGRFGVSRVRETPILSPAQSHRETDESQFNALAIKAHGAEAVLRFREKWEEVAHPDLSNVPKSPIAAKRGLKGITRHGRNLISSAAVIQERNYDRKLLSFGTVTLPGADAAELKLCSQNWSVVVKQFVKNLTRGLLRAGLPPQVFGVTEVQMRRFERYGVPALHLHFVFVGRSSKRSAWLVKANDIRGWWKQAIQRYFSPGTDYSSVENVQGIRKSVSAYLGKYMSKGAAAIAKVVEAGFADWMPSAWFTISHELRREVLHNVMRGEEVGNFLNWLCHNVVKDWVLWVAPISIERPDGSVYGVGYAGTLSAQGLDKVRQVLL